jgi:hypothetical protein
VSDPICDHCRKPIAIRNPSGFCDHLYYPAQCDICRDHHPTEINKLRARIQELEAENARLKADIKLGNAAIIYIDDTPEPREG